MTNDKLEKEIWNAKLRVARFVTEIDSTRKRVESAAFKVEQERAELARVEGQLVAAERVLANLIDMREKQ